MQDNEDATNALALEMVDTKKSILKETDDMLKTQTDITRKDISDSVIQIETTLNKKMKQLELFKEGEEILGDNAFGFAIVQELVKRAFRQEDERLKNDWSKLEKKERELRILELSINAKKAFGNITIDEANRELQNLDDEYHENMRNIANEGDENDIKAHQLKYTLNFIRKWILKPAKS